MRNIGIRLKLFIINISLLVLVVAAISTVDIIQFRRVYLSGLLERARADAYSIRDGISQGLNYFSLDSFSDMTAFLTSRLQKDFAYAYVADNNKVVLYDTDKTRIKKKLDPAIFGRLVFDKDVKSVIVSVGRYYEVVIPVVREFEVVGTIHVGISKKIIDDGVVKNVSNTIAILVAALLLSIVLLFVFLDRGIARPISNLVSKVNAISALFHLATHKRQRGGDELTELTDAFDMMTKELEEKTYSRDYVRSIIENILDALFVINAHGKIETVNRAAMRLIASTEEDIKGKEINSYLLNESRIFKSDQFVSLVENGLIKDYESVIRTKDGRSVPVMANFSIMKREKDSEPKIVCMIKDISERKIAEKVRADKESAEAANRAKTQFLAHMSHEIRTPLNAVIGFAGLLEKTQLDDSQRDYVMTICDSGKVLTTLINDILDISKIEAGELKLEAIDFNIRYLLESVIRMVRPRLKDTEVELVYSIDETLPPYFCGDPTRIRQIILNLLANAVKFTRKGRIDVRIENDADVSLNSTSMMVRFVVKDTGIGIPLPKQGMIFDAFTQADESTTRRFGGTGLGLTIVKALCEKMSGHVSVQSVEGKGSIFTVEVLLQKADNPVHDALVSHPEEYVKGKNVIIVDSNLHDREDTEACCKKNGMVVVLSTGSANDVLGWFARHTEAAHILFTDMELPDMDGCHLAEVIRDDRRFDTMKLIAVVSSPAPGMAQKCSDHGFDAFIPKPVTCEELMNVVRCTFNIQKQTGRIMTRHLCEEVLRKSVVRVLVVEDNATNMKLMGLLLKNIGCEYDGAVNGKEAIEKIAANHYDLVFMDLQMPVMGGLEAVEEIRSRVDKEVPIVALTAYAMKEDEERCLAAGMNDYLSKPIDPMKLRERLLKWTHLKV